MTTTDTERAMLTAERRVVSAADRAVIAWQSARNIPYPAARDAFVAAYLDSLAVEVATYRAAMAAWLADGEPDD